MSQPAKQAAPQGQLSLHQPEEAGEYIVDSSEEFNQGGDKPASIPTSENIEKGEASRSVERVDKEIVDYAPRIESATPAMKQYFKAKVEHPDSLLFYRMGDFYEMFCEDALEAAAILDIALTKRGKQGDQDIPMCGVPFHAYEQYAEKLIRAGKRVAVCEQMESPEEAKKRGHKSVVHREVVRILTPGTLTEEALLDASASNYLASVAHDGSSVAIAWLDFSTGEVLTSACTYSELAAALSRVNPKELVLSDALQESTTFKSTLSEYADISIAKPQSFIRVGSRKTAGDG